MTIGSLFSGIGGLELGLERAGLGPVVWQVEADPWCRQVLEKHWPGVDRYTRVENVGAHNLAPVEVICGGFPCQDVSTAGSGAGLSGARSGLWFEFARIVYEMRPSWVVVENVASGANAWVDFVTSDLAECSYAVLPIPIQASDVGAPHRRSRVFLVGRRVMGDTYSFRYTSERYKRSSVRRSRRSDDHRSNARVVWPPAPEDADGWRKYSGPEPGLYRDAYGLPAGMDRSEWKSRIKGLGNAVVPQCAEVVGYVIRELIYARQSQIDCAE